MENFWNDYDQNQNDFSNLKKVIMESSDASYDNMSTPFPIVTNVVMPSHITISIPIYAEYEDNLIQEEYDTYGGGSTLNW